ncbi:MAG: hypothetical protein AB1801_25975, partial [Chloroflexota bacterium]
MLRRKKSKVIVVVVVASGLLCLAIVAALITAPGLIREYQDQQRLQRLRSQYQIVETAEFKVTRDGTQEIKQEGLPRIYLSPNAVPNDTVLHIEKLEKTSGDPDTQAAGPIFDITLEDGELQQPVEIALPITLSPQQLESRSVYVAYLDEDIEDWVRLPSWVSTEDRLVHTTASHFTLFGLQSSPISFFHVTPDVFYGVHTPPCFEDDLIVRMNLDNQNNEIDKVELKLRVDLYIRPFTREWLTGVPYGPILRSMNEKTDLEYIPGNTTSAAAITYTVVFTTTEDDDILTTAWF